MKIIADCHLHSSFSGDSDTAMEDMTQCGIELGLETLCFTEHMDFDYPVTPETPEDFFCLDIEAYRFELFRLKDKYEGQIALRFGIEFGLEARQNDKIAKFAQAYPFDFIIASTHICNDIDPYMSEFFTGRSDSEAYRAFFTTSLENIRRFDDFDVYGHLDYAVRYGKTPVIGDYYDENRDLIDEILTVLVNKGKGLEINTAALRYHLREPHPCKAIVQRFLELGGEIVTVGSDAHNTSGIAYGFDVAADVLLECGFSYYTVFEKRKPIFIRI